MPTPMGLHSSNNNKKKTRSVVISPEETALTRIPPENTGAPHLEARKVEGRGRCNWSEAWLLPGRSTPF
jgi:hypothetical protein